MADDNEYRGNRDNDRGSRAARTLATIALILSLIALGWAIRADRHAQDAMNRADQALNQQR